MKLVLEITSTHQSGKKVWLNPGQALVVGGTEAADFRVPHDETIAPAHFRVTWNGEAWRIRDLATGTGTIVGGRRITEDRLFHDDRIVAGRAHFAVRIDGTATRPVATSEPIATPAEPSAVESAAAAGHRGEYWTLGCLPAEWDLNGNQASRVLDGAPIPTTLLIGEKDLRPGITLRDHVDRMAAVVRDQGDVDEVQGPHEIEGTISDEAFELVIRHKESSGVVLEQRQVFLRRAQSIGTATFITSADQLDQIRPDIDRIVGRLAFGDPDSTTTPIAPSAPSGGAQLDCPGTPIGSS